MAPTTPGRLVEGAVLGADTADVRLVGGGIGAEDGEVGIEHDGGGDVERSDGGRVVMCRRLDDGADVVGARRRPADRRQLGAGEGGTAALVVGGARVVDGVVEERRRQGDTAVDGGAELVGELVDVAHDPHRVAHAVIAPVGLAVTADELVADLATAAPHLATGDHCPGDLQLQLVAHDASLAVAASSPSSVPLRTPVCQAHLVTATDHQRPAVASERRIVGLALAALGALVVEPMYVLVDTTIVGRIGTAELGGLALSATVLSLVVSGCTFLVYGTTEQVARRVGGGDGAAASATGVQAIWLAALVAVPLAAVVGVTARPVAVLLGGSDEVVRHATTYLQISAVGLPAVIVVLAAQGVQRGFTDYRTPMVILLASNAVNAGLEVLFVFGLDLGVPGSAWSTVIAQVLAAGAFAVVVRRHLRGAADHRPRWSAMRPLLDAGRHLLVRSAAMLAVVVGTTSVAARTDEPTLAAHQIAASVLVFIALALDALAIPAQTLVAEHLGAGDVVAAAVLGRRVVRLTVWCALVAAALIAVVAPILPRVFTGDAEVIGRATSALWWLAALLVPAGIAYALDGVLIGAGDYRFLGRAAVAITAVLVPFGVAAVVWQWGVVGVWAVLAAWMLLRSTVNYRRADALLGARSVVPG